MPVIEFIGGTRTDSDAPQFETAQLVNLYREKVGDGAVLKAVPGMVPFAQPDAVLVRAMREVQGVLYAVIGGGLYQINSDGDSTWLADIPDDEHTTISGNTGAVTITAAGRYFVWDAGALTEPATAAITSIQDAVFFGHHTVLIEKGGRGVQPSAAADPTTFDSGDAKVTEARDDNNLRVLPIGGALWIFKEESIQLYAQDTGGGILVPLPGQTIDIGLKAFTLLTEVPNGAAFVGSDGIVYAVLGNGVAPISSRGVVTAIEQNDPAGMFYYETRDHKMICVSFKDRPAWCYDMATAEWHERAESYPFAAWQAVASAKAYGKWLVGNRTGRIHELARVATDIGTPLIRRAVSRNFNNDNNLLTLDSVQFGIETGGADIVEATSVLSTLVSGTDFVTTGDSLDSRPAEIWFRLSDDRGMTWGQPRHLQIGAVGDYKKRVIKRRLGQFRNIAIEVNCSEPANVSLGSQVDVETS